MKPNSILEFIRILKEGESVGDAAALKLAFLGKERRNSHTESVLALKESTFIPLEVSELLAYPSGSFGKALGDFLSEHDLKPLNFSQRSWEKFDLYPIGMRYIRIHDMVHVLTGFKPDIAGEIGVYAFIKEQNYSRILNFSANTAKLVGRSMFWRLRVNREAERRGAQLAKQALPLIREPFEKKFDWPLEKLRAHLGIALETPIALS